MIRRLLIGRKMVDARTFLAFRPMSFRPDCRTCDHEHHHIIPQILQPWSPLLCPRRYVGTALCLPMKY